MADRISVEVAYALPDESFLVSLTLPAGSSVADALEASQIQFRYPGISLADLGIWSRPVERTAPLNNGDRVEIYRPLELDPNEQRLRRYYTASD